jgi:serine/threonine protein phosphatase 1
MTNKYRKILEVNTKGRDFVVGDLHGCYERLMTFLAHVKFDKEVDRLIFVGDLPDRGPDSYQCVILLQQPWVYAVKGNHESMMVDYFTQGPYAPYFVQNGGRWGTKYQYTMNTDESKELVKVLEIAKELPLILTVPMTNGKQFHVIHAELDSNYTLTDTDLDNQEVFDEVAFEQSIDGDYIIWGRKIFYSWYATKITTDTILNYAKDYKEYSLGAMFGPKLSHIYCGHTVVTQPLTIGGQTNLDTGAFYSQEPDRYPWAGLTVTEPLTGKFWITNSEGTKETTNVVII